jgi:hypothetical protein
MAAYFYAEAPPRHAYSQATRSFSPSGLERLKLDRLRELRAVIDSMRAEREVSPPPDVFARGARN